MSAYSSSYSARNQERAEALERIQRQNADGAAPLAMPGSQPSRMMYFTGPNKSNFINVLILIGLAIAGCLAYSYLVKRAEKRGQKKCRANGKKVDVDVFVLAASTKQPEDCNNCNNCDSCNTRNANNANSNSNSNEENSNFNAEVAMHKVAEQGRRVVEAVKQPCLRFGQAAMRSIDNGVTNTAHAIDGAVDKSSNAIHNVVAKTANAVHAVAQKHPEKPKMAAKKQRKRLSMPKWVDTSVAFVKSKMKKTKVNVINSEPVQAVHHATEPIAA